MTCGTTSTGVNTYEFKKNGTSISRLNSSSATYTMTAATIGRDDGNYTCVAKIDTVASDESDIFQLTISEYLNFLYNTGPPKYGEGH